MKNSPSITASKLVEYSFATPQRRLKIIENAIEPPNFILDTKYSDIERATAQFLKSACTDDSRLRDLDKALLKREYSTNHEENRILNAHDAIEQAATTDWKIPANVGIDIPIGYLGAFDLEGLNVSVKPAVILRRNKSGYKNSFIGAIKPYFGKTSPLEVKGNADRGVLFANLLHWYVEESLQSIGFAEPDLCLVGDIFAQRVYFAARQYKQRRNQLRASALEILDRWDAVRTRLHEQKQAQTAK